MTTMTDFQMNKVYTFSRSQGLDKRNCNFSK
jgi:hypothetical protein